MILAILQARYSSSRLPGKVLRPLLEKPMLYRQIERIKQARRIDALVVATSTAPSDDAIEAMCVDYGLQCYRGSLDDVLDRFYQAATKFKADHVVRLTGDCPLCDPSLIDQVIEKHVGGGFDYTSNVLPPTYPDGLDIEIFRYTALKAAWTEAKLTSEREHVTPFIHGQPKRFAQGSVQGTRNLSHLRWTVDDPADFELVEKIYQSLYPKSPKFTTQDVLNFLEANKELMDLNKNTTRNEGFTKSLRKDEFEKRYQKSLAMLERALKVIPLGSQTFSKSKTQYPVGVSPMFIERGQGSKVWDVDGNKYIDFVNSLAAINLGYCDPDVTKAVEEQLRQGTVFSLPHPLETQVAEQLVKMVPGVEMVRFGKNGSDATAGAIRVSRAHTGRDHVAVCGYHGWQDWYIGSTARNLGVPEATRNLTHQFTYNKIDSLRDIFKKFPDQVAAVIMEPMNLDEPQGHFLSEVKELAHKNGAIFILDETVTGFRYANGGAQEYFNVTADLVTFGKGVANGYPIAAIGGRADLMKWMEEIFFSFTFGGETLSLAAALATMKKLEREPVIETMYRQGRKVLTGADALIKKHELENVFSLSGNPTWSFLRMQDTPRYSQWQIKTLFLQEIFVRGILALGSHNMNYAHSDDDVATLLKAYDEVFEILGKAIRNETLEKQLLVSPLVPLFKVR